MRVSERIIEQHKREQMLKLVAKGFYRELIKYGVGKDEIMTVATNLLGHVSEEPEPVPTVRGTEALLSLAVVKDEWREHRCIDVLGVQLRPLPADSIPLVAAWLRDPEARASFVPEFPAEEAELGAYLTAENREYFGIFVDDTQIGFIGADDIDLPNQKLEMKKLVGATEQRGAGVGTRATFAFLYYCFMLRGAHKVCVHFCDVNIRNLNLNSRIGFELEGLFIQELRRPEGRVEVVRMSLLKPRWLTIFSRTG